MKRFLVVAVITVLLIGLTMASGSTMAQEQGQYGGTLVVTFQSDIATLDPAIGYDWQNWSIIKSVFNGLMGYKPGTTELEPQLAKSFPEVSPDGKTYTFTLRKGVKFQNGRELTAQDVKYSLERMLNPKTESPGQGFYVGIEGAQAFIDGKADAVSGIRVLDRYTVRISLSKPDASFLQKLALNFAYVVPKEEVKKYGTDFGHHPVGTGAFKLKKWELGQSVVLERNPDYFVKGRPFLDGVVFNLGIDPSVAFLQLLSGKVDILGDGIPSARFTGVMNDPKLSKLVVIADQLETSYVTLNVHTKPLDDVRVRQALNMAINKERIVRIINGRATPANQILPPLMPGYAKNYKGYSYDPAKAKDLLAEAGYPNGFTTQLYTYNVDPNPRISQAIQQDLAQIGVKVEVKPLAQSTVIDAGGSGKAPMIWSGGMAWIDDYPDPNDFYWPILSCAGAVQGGWNWAKYCNHDLDKQAAAADAMVQPNQKDQRMAAYRDIFVKIMEDAPWIPIFNEKQITMHSARVGGADALFVDPINIPVNYPEVYIKQQ